MDKEMKLAIEISFIVVVVLGAISAILCVICHCTMVPDEIEIDSPAIIITAGNIEVDLSEPTTQSTPESITPQYTHSYYEEEPEPPPFAKVIYSEQIDIPFAQEV